MGTTQAPSRADEFLRRATSMLVAGACAAILGYGGAQAATVGDQPAPTLTPWVSSQSYSRGPRFDPRLDADVVFWRAGLTLAKVFTGVAEQTGVEIACWPPGDENERVRVTLFLNAKKPPSVRDLLAQLAWITDCSFATEDTGRPEAPYRYYLLSTSVADSAQTRLNEDREAAFAAMRQTWEERTPSEAEVSQRLDEYIAALDLSMGQLFARYQGVDDHLLAAMVDDQRRAAVGFLASLDSDSRESVLAGEPVSFAWDELTGEQQAALESCLRAPAFGFGGPGRRGPPDELTSWTGADVAHLQIFGLSFGSPMISAELAPGETERRGRRGRFLMSPMLDLMGARELTPDEIAALRRARGERVSEEDEESLFREWRETRRGEMQTQRQERVREATEERFSQDLPLSPAVEDQLSSLQVPLDDEASYSLWQIQEAVAKATGLHIASDCFYQPPRNLRAEAESLYPGEPRRTSALLALRLAALSTEDSRRVGWMPGEDYRAGWEWQDAGTFLHFRSRARDLWRAALLSPAAAAYLDSWFDTQLAQAVASKNQAPRVDVTVDTQWTSALVAGLTDLQLAHGGELICGDPQDETASYRQQLREGVLDALNPASEALRALSRLSDGQWELLRNAGLRVANDLTPAQRAAFNLEPRAENAAPEEARGRGGRGRGGPGFGRGGPAAGGRRGPGGFGPGRLRLEDDREMARLVMRLTDESPYPPREERGTGAGEGNGPPGGRGWERSRAAESDWLSFWVGDELRGAIPLPRRLSIQLAVPAPSPRLASPSAEGS